MPRGMPSTAAIANEVRVRNTVTPKSCISSPPASPPARVTRVSQGPGRRIGLIRPLRTTRSQMINRAAGPTAGSRRACQGFPARTSVEAGGAQEPPLADAGAPAPAVVAKVLVFMSIGSGAVGQPGPVPPVLVHAALGELAVELLEMARRLRRELVVEQVVGLRHLGGQRTLDGRVPLEERPRLGVVLLDQLHAPPIG